jgi:hypothetical protein
MPGRPVNGKENPLISLVNYSRKNLKIMEIAMPQFLILKSGDQIQIIRKSGNTPQDPKSPWKEIVAEDITDAMNLFLKPAPSVIPGQIPAP